MNETQFVVEILSSCLISYCKSLDNRDRSRLIEDGLRVHSGVVAKTLQKGHSIKKDDWPHGSPDSNY